MKSYSSTRDAATRKKQQLQRDALRRSLSNARDMSYLGGASLGEVAQTPLACLPSTIPAVRTVSVPMTSDDFDDAFGPEFSLIPDDTTQQSAGLVTKLTTGGSPLAPFFMRAAGLIFRADPAAWAMIGAAATRPTVPGDAPVVERVIAPGTPGLRPAVFEYNHRVLQGISDMLQCYQFQYLLQGRFLMINERGVDVGLLDSSSHIGGFGHAQAEPGLIIEECNDYLKTADPTHNIFVWPNAISVPPSTLPIEPPLVDIQYTNVCVPGVFGKAYPVRPHVLFPGQTYQFLLNRIHDSDYFERLKAGWTMNGNDLQKPDSSYNDLTAGGVAWAGYVPFRYGKLQYGVILRGAEVYPEEALQWMLAFGQPYMSVISQPEVWSQVDAMARACGLSGVPRPLGLRHEDKRWQNTAAIDALFNVLGGDIRSQNPDGSLAGVEFATNKLNRADIGRMLQVLDDPMTPGAANVGLPRKDLGDGRSY